MNVVSRLCIAGYRSLRDIRIELEAFTVVAGANGCGKSSLYRSLKLLWDIAQGHVVQSLAVEGGLQSTLWAGPESFSQSMRDGKHAVQGTTRKAPVSLKLGFSSQAYGYAIDLGLPLPYSSRFSKDLSSRRKAFGRASNSGGRPFLPSGTARPSASATGLAPGAKPLQILPRSIA